MSQTIGTRTWVDRWLRSVAHPPQPGTQHHTTPESDPTPGRKRHIGAKTDRRGGEGVTEDVVNGTLQSWKNGSGHGIDESWDETWIEAGETEREVSLSNCKGARVRKLKQTNIHESDS